MSSLASSVRKFIFALTWCFAAGVAAAQEPAPQSEIAAALVKLAQAVEGQSARIDALLAELKQARGATTANFEAPAQPPVAQPPAPAVVQPPTVVQPPVAPPATVPAPVPPAPTAGAIPAGDVPLLVDDGAPPLAAPEVIGPFGLDALVAEFHAGNRLRTDQEPDVTAAMIAKLFADLAGQFRPLPRPLSDAQRAELRVAFDAGVKSILDDPQRGFERRPQWQGFFVQLEAKLAQARQGVPATFQADNPAHYVVALTELAHGFTELAIALKGGRDLPPSYFQNRGMAATAAAGNSGGYATGYSGGASHAAVWHARHMNHIMYRYDRRAYRIDRIYGRR